MPPFGVRQYETKDEGEDFDPEVVAHKNNAELNAYRAVRVSKQRFPSFKANWKTASNKGLDTPKAYYSSEDLEPNQRMAAWINHHSGAETDLLTQVEEQDKFGEWRTLDEPEVRAHIAALNTVYEGIDEEDLTLAARRQLAIDLDETVALVLKATEAEVGVSARDIY